MAKKKTKKGTVIAVIVVALIIGALILGFTPQVIHGIKYTNSKGDEVVFSSEGTMTLTSHEGRVLTCQYVVSDGMLYEINSRGQLVENAKINNKFSITTTEGDRYQNAIPRYIIMGFLISLVVGTIIVFIFLLSQKTVDPDKLK